MPPLKGLIRARDFAHFQPARFDFDAKDAHLSVVKLNRMAIAWRMKDNGRRLQVRVPYNRSQCRRPYQKAQISRLVVMGWHPEAGGIGRFVCQRELIGVPLFARVSWEVLSIHIIHGDFPPTRGCCLGSRGLLTKAYDPRRQVVQLAEIFVGVFWLVLNLEFSAPPRRSLRLRGE